MSRLECRLRPRAQARKNMRQAHAARGISVPDLLADETTHCGTIDATFGHLCGHACAVRLSLSTSQARALLGTATLSRRIFRALKVRAASIRGQRAFCRRKSQRTAESPRRAAHPPAPQLCRRRHARGGQRGERVSRMEGGLAGRLEGLLAGDFHCSGGLFGELGRG